MLRWTFQICRMRHPRKRLGGNEGKRAKVWLISEIVWPTVTCGCKNEAEQNTTKTAQPVMSRRGALCPPSNDPNLLSLIWDLEWSSVPLSSYYATVLDFEAGSREKGKAKSADHILSALLLQTSARGLTAGLTRAHTRHEKLLSKGIMASMLAWLTIGDGSDRVGQFSLQIWVVKYPAIYSLKIDIRRNSSSSKFGRRLHVELWSVSEEHAIVSATRHGLISTRLVWRSNSCVRGERAKFGWRY